MCQSSKMTNTQAIQMNIEINVKQFARDIKAGKSIGGKDEA